MQDSNFIDLEDLIKKILEQDHCIESYDEKVYDTLGHTTVRLTIKVNHHKGK